MALSTEIMRMIISHIQPTRISYRNVQAIGRDLVNLACVYPTSKIPAYEALVAWKRIYVLTKRYSNHETRVMSDDDEDLKDQPCSALYDALMSGFYRPMCHPSLNAFNKLVAEDCRDIIQFIPSALNFKGEIRCRDYVCVLMMATINRRVDIGTIKALIDAGARPSPVLLNGRMVSMMDDCTTVGISHTRLEEIKTYLSLAKEQ